MLDTSLNSSNFYFLLAVFQGIILTFIILFRKPIRRTNIFFGLLLLLFSLSLLHLVLEKSISGFNAKFPIPMEFSLSYGPLAYLHILYIKNPKRIFLKKDLLHFLPSLLLDGVFFTTIFLYIKTHIDWAYENIHLIQTIALVISFFGAVQLCIYTYFTYRESIEAKRMLREFQKIKKWINYLMISWSLLIGFLVFAVPIGLIYIEEVDNNSALFYKPIGTLISLSIYLLGYLYVLKYAKLVENYSERISKFSLSEKELEVRKDQLLYVLKEHKIYNNSSLTIAKLANHLNLPINSLSNVINESLHTNFNDLINHYRIEAFKKLAFEPESQKYSIVGLGQEVGFRSKASFYRAFKKETGVTPSQFIKSQP